MEQNLQIKFIISACMYFAVQAGMNAQSNMLSGMISSGPAYTFTDEVLFDDLPKNKPVNTSNAKVIEEHFAENTITVKASKLVVDYNQGAKVEFSAVAPWATDYMWKFGDGTVLSGLQNTSHTFKQPGVYKVSVAASNDQEIKREVIEIKVIDNQKGIKLEEMGHFVVFPTGNNLIADIQLDLPTRERKLFVELQDIEGERVLEQLVGKVKKRQKIRLDFGEIPEGKYYAVLKGKRYSMVSRITVIKS